MSVGTAETSFFEQSRLAELADYRILDTEPELGFDDLVMLARLICDAPIATVTFVANQKQWFKAVSGLDFCESPIAESICAYAIRQPDIFEIPDLAADQRTRAMLIVDIGAFRAFLCRCATQEPVRGEARHDLCDGYESAAAPANAQPKPLPRSSGKTSGGESRVTAIVARSSHPLINTERLAFRPSGRRRSMWSTR